MPNNFIYNIKRKGVEEKKRRQGAATKKKKQKRELQIIMLETGSKETLM